MLRRVRPAEAASTLVGLAAVSVAVWTWTDARPWPADARGSSAPAARSAAGPVPTPGGSPVPAPPADAAGSGGGAGTSAASGEAGTGAGASGAEGVSFDGASVGTGASSGAGAVAGGAAGRPGGTGTGRACLVLAPSGAEGAGHNGWAFRLPDGRWLAGSTENNQENEVLGLFEDGNTDGALWTDAGGRTDTWSRTLGGFDAVRTVFRSHLDVGGRWMHDAGYYTQARCADVVMPDVAAAREAVARAAHSGYGLVSDNCLTKAVDILDAYGADLPDAFLEEPNDYISTTAAGFGTLRAL